MHKLINEEDYSENCESITKSVSYICALQPKSEKLAKLQIIVLSIAFFQIWTWYRTIRAGK